MHITLDPRICNIHLDANALDRNGTARDVLVDRVIALREARAAPYLIES